MDKKPLVIEQIDAGRVFAERFNAFASVDAMFWISPADSDKWLLYIASKEINDQNMRGKYKEVLGLVGTNRDLWLDAFQINLLNVADPLAIKVIEIRDRYSDPSPIRYNGSSIAGLEIDGAYIYPLTLTTSAAP